ncbi:cob(I)yrinic acid a,c-diamide adenosyltransferase [Rubrivirga marina]|uniref:Corrinoid adenosyltransferase n=1 Tax=Rubrivirga marina TaxID=1196024 RepID=A0A271J003_9BACT|nr:cob(I)yrinic acid a,c-diamide adenosyltransferase [Rubrivirga marina]PAP76831.1 ATP:cob(I)alamin adenosyltransferase [Rubrivirga marina]
MKVYTRTGDDGTTALFGGGRVAKSHPRIAAYGTVDEANAALGMARAALADADDALRQRADALLGRIQEELFVLGGDLASPGDVKYPVPRIDAAHTEQLEADIDALTSDLTPLKHFVLPGGTPAAAALHLARTICRRAERHVVETAALEEISADALHYLNRLSDFLFTLARWVNHAAGVAEPVWAPVADRTPSGD